VARFSARAWCCLDAQGIVELLVDAGEGICWPVLVLLLLWGRGTCVVGVFDRVFAGALLGPEAIGFGVTGPGGCCFVGVVFENCRVDASIFVVKL
jgi:hypothetical protein